MTAPGGIAYDVTADASGFDEELRRAVMDAMRDVQRELDMNPLDVAVFGRFDDTGLATEIENELRGLEAAHDFKVAVGADFQSTGVAAEIETWLAGANRNITVGADFQIDAAQLAQVQGIAALSDIDIKVKVDIEADAAKLASLAVVKDLADKDVSVKLDLDIPADAADRLKAIAPALRTIRTLTDQNLRIKIDLDLPADAATRLKQIAPALRSIRDLTDKNIRIKIDVEMDPLQAQRLERIGPALKSLRGLTSKDIRIKIDIQVDEAQLHRVALALREIRSQTVRLNIISDADRAADDVDRLRLSLGGLGAGAGGAAAVAAAIAGIGGAAGLALGAVGGLVAGALALGPAVAVAIGTATVALQGVGDAFSAMSAMSENSGTEAAAQADKIAAAASAVDSAQDSARSTARAYADAQEDAVEANEELADSYDLAKRDLQDLLFEQRGAVISQKEAALALDQARRELADAKTIDDYRDALVGVERAQLNYDRAVDKSAQAKAEYADAEAKGIENSDRVVEARERARDAEEAAATAGEAAARSAQQVADAQANLAKVQAEGTPSAQKYGQALAELAPSARAMVEAAQAAKPAWDDFQNSVQEAFFKNSAAAVTDLANNALPVLEDGMVGVATQMNEGAIGFTKFLTSAEGLRGLDAVFGGAENLIAGMRQGIDGLGTGMVDLAVAAEPAMAGIGQALGGIGAEIGKVFSDMAASGQLDSIFDGLTRALQGLGPMIGDLLEGLLTIADKVLPALGPLFEMIGAAFLELAPSLGDLGKVFAETFTEMIPPLTVFIDALIKGLAPVLPVLGDLLISMLNALTPLIGPLSEIAVVVGNALVGAIDALAPSIGPIGEAFAALVSAVAPLVPLLAEGLSTVLLALAPALTQVFTALAPVIAQFAEQMRPVLEQMAPILAEVAMTLGMALADALRQIAPVIPDLVRSFSGLLLAVLPILPEFARMAAELLPSLVDVLLAIIPQVITLTDKLAWLVTNVIIPLVIPYVQMMVDGIRMGMDVVADAVNWARDSATAAFGYLTDTVFPALGRGLDQVKEWFRSGVDAISQEWDRMKEAAAVPVRFAVNTVWNEGLLKAWNSVADFLPGLEPMKPVTLGFRTGGAVSGPGTGTSDSVPAWLSTGEHIITAAEVLAAGGQNIWYAIRDMVARGVPFTWDGGRVIQDLGRANLDAYGSAVRTRGIGNVSPEGLFDSLMPRYRTGGEVLPWMHQLKRGHDFARAQDGRNYQWAGPRFVGDSFDCSGFMASIIAAILGGNPWTRYWATSSFAGYPQVGAQGLVKNLTEGVGMLVGITDDPGGPGGGHTAGELRGIPELGIPSARVESGGALGDVHYGRGTPVNSFASLYGLPIGANGFFQPSTGGGSVGPSPDSQRGFVQAQIDRVFREITDPLRAEMEARIGPPPPAWNRIPPEFLQTVSDKAATHLGGLVGGLSDLLPSAWSKAQELAGRAFEALTPFDSGGLASGVGFMPKNVISPERVLSPEQTRLFESLVVSLQQIAGTGAAGGSAPELLTAQVFQQGLTTLAALLGRGEEPGAEQQVVREVTEVMERQGDAITEQGLVLADTRDLIDRTSSSQEQVAFQIAEQERIALAGIADALGFDVLMPIVQSGMDAALEVVQSWLKAGFGQVTAAADRTTTAVENQESGIDDSGFVPPAFGAPGSAFDATKAISDAVVSVAGTVRSTFEQVAQQIADAALAQKPSRVGNSKGTLGQDISGGPLVDMIVRLTGVEIEVRDMLEDTLAEIRDFKGELGETFDASGRIVQDTAELMQRNESSRDIVLEEQNRLNRELIKAVLRYLMTAVLIPILTAILGAMITLVSTAIGAAIGASIPVIGPLIGAALGAVIGAALGGLASVFTGLIAVGAGAAIDSFDEGGVAHGIGMLPKNTLKPERVLSPRQTESFDRLVSAIEGGQFGRREINAPIQVLSGGPGTGHQVRDHLLSLL